MRGCLLSEFTSMVASPLAPPRSIARGLAAICKLPDDVIGYSVALTFGEPFFQSTYDLAGAPKCALAIRRRRFAG